MIGLLQKHCWSIQKRGLNMHKLLITCPAMINSKSTYAAELSSLDINVTTPSIEQQLTESKLIKLIPEFDAWIIGDDPATFRVVEAGKKGRLKAAVKWGAGTDNIDFSAFEKFNIPITNTPALFGEEVADVALNYIISLARQTLFISNEVKNGLWPKPQGMSLAGKKIGVVGYGAIGKALVKRLKTCNMQVVCYDPLLQQNQGADFEIATWPNRLAELDYLVLCCALTKDNHQMLNEETIALCKTGIRIVNVSRGQLIDENALCTALQKNKVHSVALEVFSTEPPEASNTLLKHPQSIFGSHNSSNTLEAVIRANKKAISLICEMLQTIVAT